MSFFRKKPVVIQAIQFTDSSVKFQIAEWAIQLNGARGVEMFDDHLLIHTLEGTMKANLGDWIIKGVKGEFYPCRKDIFEETYEAV